MKAVTAAGRGMPYENKVTVKSGDTGNGMIAQWRSGNKLDNENVMTVKRDDGICMEDFTAYERNSIKMTAEEWGVSQFYDEDSGCYVDCDSTTLPLLALVARPRPTALASRPSQGGRRWPASVSQRALPPLTLTCAWLAG